MCPLFSNRYLVRRYSSYIYKKASRKIHNVLSEARRASSSVPPAAFIDVIMIGSPSRVERWTFEP
jgi:hypothetical protein